MKVLKAVLCRSGLFAWQGALVGKPLSQHVSRVDRTPVVHSFTKVFFYHGDHVPTIKNLLKHVKNLDTTSQC